MKIEIINVKNKEANSMYALSLKYSNTTTIIPFTEEDWVNLVKELNFKRQDVLEEVLGNFDDEEY